MDHLQRSLYPLTLAVTLTLLGCSDKPKPAPTPEQVQVGDLTPALASEPDKDGYVTLIHPMVSRLANGDFIQLALHWEKNNQPIQESDNPVQVDWKKSVETMTFHVTTPDGKDHALTTKLEKPKLDPGPQPFHWSPTVILSLRNTGPILMRPDYRGKWNGENLPKLNTPGKYSIRVEGRIIAEAGLIEIPFKSKTIEVEIGAKNYKSLVELEDLGRKALKDRVQAELRGDAYVIEDSNGNRLLRVSGKSEKVWHFIDYTVVLTPDGKDGQIIDTQRSNCLAKGTTLSGEHGPVRIENVQPGMRIWGYDLKKKQNVLTTVRFLRAAEVTQTLVINQKLRLTGAHPMYVGGQWKSADQLLERDTLLTQGGQLVRVNAVEQKQGAVRVYDLTVDEPHNFFADGVLTHNKSRVYSPSLDDVWYRLWPASDQKKK